MLFARTPCRDIGVEFFSSGSIPPTIVSKDDWERNLILTALIFSEHVHNGVVLGWFAAVPFGHGLNSPCRELFATRVT